MIDVDIRTVAVDERRAAADTLRAALLSGPVSDEHFESDHASWDDTDSLAAWEGDRCVGHVAAFRFDTTVPGGAQLPIAAVTRVGVLPTHTRRGLLTRMMHQLLRESHERGKVLATLHASETPIYRRFGFGLGTDAIAALVTPATATPWRVPARPGSMRLLPHSEVAGVVPALYERVRWQIGSISRPEWRWRRIVGDATRPTETPYGKGSFVAVHSDVDGIDDGYVYYDVDWEETFGANPIGTGKVRDLWGASPQVEIELWRYVLAIDLVKRWRTEPRPVDEAVRRAMHDARAYEAVQRLDEQWVRLLDVDTALAARTYGPARRGVSVRVVDPMFAANNATWCITADGAARTDAASDVEVDIATLSASYLGGVSWHDLAVSSALDVPATLLADLDALFTVHPAPFCGTFY